MTEEIRAGRRVTDPVIEPSDVDVAVALATMAQRLGGIEHTQTRIEASLASHVAGHEAARSSAQEADTKIRERLAVTESRLAQKDDQIAFIHKTHIEFEKEVRDGLTEMRRIVYRTVGVGLGGAGVVGAAMALVAAAFGVKPL